MHSEEWYRNWKKPEIQHGVPTKWGWTVLYPENLHMAQYVDIGAGSFLQAEAGIWLGGNVQLGGHVLIYSKDTIGETTGSVRIERNARIGAGTIILPNVVVGENSIVGAGTTLLKDVPPNVIIHPEQRLVMRRLETSNRRSEAI